jgi:hypothetical protein
MQTFTLDTNCIIDLDEKRPSSSYIQKLADAHAAGIADVALVAVSASERQKGDTYLDSFDVFKERVEKIGLAHLQVLKAIGYRGISFWGMALYPSEAMVSREREIHDALFPSIPFSWSDYATAQGLDLDAVKTPEAKRWRNTFCDRQMYWAHDHNNRQCFVTSDAGFSRILGHSAFPTAKVMTPEDAIALL